MNKQELIKKYENEWKEHSPFNETASYALMVKSFLDQLKKMDEPQKVKIPKFVADWIEYCKNTSLSLVRSLMLGNVDFGNYANQKDHSKLIEFFRSGINQETFARAWLDGFEIEKEKRYYVRLKNVDENYNYLTCIKHLNAWALTEIKKDKKFRTEHTKKQLEEGNFGWVFDCPGIEIEEVE